MSLVVVALSLLMSLGVGAFSVDIARVTWEKARAQTAADAAALAAVAESGPYGRGQPAQQARSFAEANNARLLECLCEPGATAMQVKVAVGRIAAEARAVLDPTLLRPASSAIDARGLDPQLAGAVRSLIAASHGAVRLVSGYRSRTEQAALWEGALQRYGSRQAAEKWVAPPGDSMHERGLAVDLGGDLPLAFQIVAQQHLPLWRPLANEPWHFELIGSRG
ncbi:MAG: zinc D-Ala-D-Ala carboxypeptidase [Actinomycetota bacterium]|nr:zinc D-Ala-D-Ala carboxypeptidase [Actinomycetota bacterium]